MTLHLVVDIENVVDIDYKNRQQEVRGSESRPGKEEREIERPLSDSFSIYRESSFKLYS